MEEILFTAAIAYFAWKGFRAGVPRMVMRIFSLLAAYLCTWLLIGTLAKHFSDNMGMSYISSYLVAGVTLFFAVFIGLNILMWIVSRMTGLSDDNDNSSVGAIVGGAVGVIVGLLLVWASGVLMDSIDSRQQQAEQLQPQAQLETIHPKNNSAPAGENDPAKAAPNVEEKKKEKILNRIANSTVQKAAELALKASNKKEDKTPIPPQVGAAVLANPTVVSKQLTEMIQSPQARTMLSDATVMQALNNGDQQALLNNVAFKHFARSPQVRNLSSSLGMQGLNGLGTEEQLADTFIFAWQKVNNVRSNPRFAQLMQDPEVQSAIQSRNPMAMLSHPKVNELVQLIMNSERQPGATMPVAPMTIFGPQGGPQPEETYPGYQPPVEQAPQYTPHVKQEMWKWVDENGQVHYSSQKPDNIDAEMVEY